MATRVPDWLTPVSWLYIALALASAAAIAVDVYSRGRRHATVAEEVVWVTSALYLGPFALPLYARHGRTPRARDEQAAAVAGLPGGGASALAHVVGVPLVLVSGLTIAGTDLWVMILVIGLLAMVLLFAYERAASRPGRPVSAGTAASAAVLTVLAFDVGMGGWMVLLHLASFMPPATEGAFWFLMQVGIVLGLVTAYPVVTRLGRRRRTVVAA